ncbi:nef attachable domain protein, partial [Chlamydia psittaci 02DC14]
PLWVSKYQYANFTRTVLVNCLLSGKLKLCEMNQQNTMQFLRNLLFGF